MALASNQQPNTTIMQRLLFTLLVAASAIIATQPLISADKPAEKKEAAAAPRTIPFRGKIAAVDKQANTVKVGERTFQINSDTRITKAGKAGTLDEATIGEEVGGSYREGTDKKLNVVSLRIGAKPEAPAVTNDKK
jgi:hypothetical protein